MPWARPHDCQRSSSFFRRMKRRTFSPMTSLAGLNRSVSSGITNSAVQATESRRVTTSQMPFQFSLTLSKPDELRVPHRAVRIRAEKERAAAVAVAVDEDREVVVGREVGVAPKLRAAERRHVASRTPERRRTGVRRRE